MPVVIPVILAAGRSARMGRPKALLEVAPGRSFLRAILETLAAVGAAPVRVVIGPPHGELIQRAEPAANQPLGVEYLINSRPEEGMLSSLRIAIRALPDPRVAGGLLVWPVDHPHVAAQTVAGLLEQAARDPGRITVPRFAGRRGHPVVFPAVRFADLLAAPLEIGARAVVSSHPDQVIEVAVDDPGILRDIDRPEDLRRG